MITTAHDEATHYDKNLFRSGPKLERSLERLDDLWRELRDSLQGEGVGLVRAREACAIVASARWSYTAALHRSETRGQHQREDAPDMLPRFAQRQSLSGIDRIRSSFQRDSGQAEAKTG